MKRKTIAYAAALLLLSAVPACLADSNSTELEANPHLILAVPASDRPLRDLAADNTEFAFGLYRQLASKEGNLFFSPYSISEALAMTFAGAEGGTETEMRRVLNFTLPENVLHPSFYFLRNSLESDPEDQGDFALHIANALWGQTGHEFLPCFLDVLEESYAAAMKLVDFSGNPAACVQEINEWVDEETMGKITRLVSEDVINSATRLVLTNAIYFKGQWMYPFDDLATTAKPFHLLSGDTARVETMRITEHFPTHSGPDYSAVELPYKERRFAMLVVVPYEGCFVDVQDRFNSGFIQGVTDSLQNANLILSMPRFRCESSFSLEEALSAMGMSSAFGMMADFSGMDGLMDLYISSVLHKAFISVDEYGTEAAAATAVIMEKLNGEAAETFRVNRPFLYLIRDRETDTVLFIGRLLDPA